MSSTINTQPQEQAIQSKTVQLATPVKAMSGIGTPRSQEVRPYNTQMQRIMQRQQQAQSHQGYTETPHYYTMPYYQVHINVTMMSILNRLIVCL